MSEDLKGFITPNILYDVELKEMHHGNGYVVISAVPVLFEAKVEIVIVTKSIYQVNVSFGNKVIYFDPISGRSPSSKTMDRVLSIINDRTDIKDKDDVISNFRTQASKLLQRMEKDGYYIPKNK